MGAIEAVERERQGERPRVPKVLEPKVGLLGVRVIWGGDAADEGAQRKADSLSSDASWDSEGTFVSDDLPSDGDATSAGCLPRG